MKEVRKARIGFVSIAHADYLDDIVAEQTKLAIENIRMVGGEAIAVTDPVYDAKSAEAAGQYLAGQRLDGVVLFLASWLECPVFMSVLREVEHLPLCVQAFPMCIYKGKQESTGAYVSYSMIKGVLDRLKYSYTGILGSVDCDETREILGNFSAAARTVGQLKRCRIGLVGYTSMSIYTGTFDHVFMRAKIGPEIEHIDNYSLIRMADAATDAEREAVIDQYRAHATIHSEVSDEFLKKSAGIYVAMEELVETKDLAAINLKCQYEMSKEYKMVPCVPLSLLAETGCVASCEGDILNTVSMLMLHDLSGEVVTYGDSMNHTGNVLKLSSCGFNPFSMGVPGKQLIRNFMPHPGFTGIESSFVIRPGRVTVMRLIEDQCDYHIIYFTGEGLETELRQGYMPALDIRLDGRVEDLVDHYAGQHYAICFGDQSAKIELMAKMLGIRAIRI
ncbi:MAG: hypothetical protein E7486_05460 [Ruminococcaceae bacterium]|nr:hypothetical protein [Oscillospiraceae bacterium]